MIGATFAENLPGKERSAFGEAVIKLVKDRKSFRQRNFALICDRLEAMKAIIDQFCERDWIANCDRQHSACRKGPKEPSDLWPTTDD